MFQCEQGSSTVPFLSGSAKRHLSSRPSLRCGLFTYLLGRLDANSNQVCILTHAKRLPNYLPPQVFFLDQPEVFYFGKDRIKGKVNPLLT
jgi:hypothetical protein